MAETDSISSTTISPPPVPESEGSTKLPTTETESEDVTERNQNPGDVSLRIWPPTQRARVVVVNHLIETLTTESILSKKYGTLQPEEASSVAKSIEDEAYGVASASVFGDDDGSEILKAYSKEISKRMLESLKAKSHVANPTPTTVDETELAADSTESVKDDDAPAARRG